MTTSEITGIRPSWQLDRARWAFIAGNERVSDGAPQLRWWWRAVATNGVTWEGDDRFASLAACQSDAATHGYVQVPG